MGIAMMLAIESEMPEIDSVTEGVRSTYVGKIVIVPECEPNVTKWDDKPCLEMDRKYHPSNISGEGPSHESNHVDCSDRCRRVAGCATWTFDQAGAICYLQDANASYSNETGMVSGQAKCFAIPQDLPRMLWNGGQDCMHFEVVEAPKAGHNPLRMTTESNYKGCQAQCVAHKDCAHFAYFFLNQSCWLVDNQTQQTYMGGTIAGRQLCTGNEEALFDIYLSKMKRSGKNFPLRDASSCEDSLTIFKAFDLETSDLEQYGDIQPTEDVTCDSLRANSYTEGICQSSEQVKFRCPKLCGTCDIEVDLGKDENGERVCTDEAMERQPVFWLGNSSVDCADLSYACRGDEEVDKKCRQSCGWCDFSTTTTSTTEASEPYGHLTHDGCSRRRSDGYCFTRRRRLF